MARAHQRQGMERWLRANGVPTFVRSHPTPARIVRQLPAAIALGVVLFAAIAVTVLLIGIDPASVGPLAIVGSAVLAVLLGAAGTAFGIVPLLWFGARWVVAALWRMGGAMVRALPLLLVALVFTFFGTETWQTIGRLKGLPLVLASVLIAAVGLAVLVLGAHDREPAVHGAFGTAAEVAEALPEEFAPSGRLRFRNEPLRVLERWNLRAIGVFGRLVVAVLAGLTVAVFFVLFGVLTVDGHVAADWVGAPLTVWWQGEWAGHVYTLSAEHVRVAVFLGVFAGLYFIVAAASDRALAATLSTDTDEHLRTCLAVRAVYLAQADGGGRGR